MNKKELIEKIINLSTKNGYKKKNIKMIKDAIKFADAKHANQTRKSGDPYIIHPLHTALFLLEWGCDYETVIAGILHDVIEDTETSKEEIEEKFSKCIAEIVNIVSKVSEISKKNRSKEIRTEIDQKTIDYHMKIILSATSDHRAIIVKLADRLHNMQTISFLTHEKQLKIAQETFDIYANIAGRLGLYWIKTLLQDISYKILYEVKSNKIEIKLKEFLENNEKKWNYFTKELNDILIKSKIDFSISSRIKGLYSLSKKIEEEKKINEIYDLFANRIIINGEVEECYKVLGLIHTNFLWIPNTFKDYISSPKLNMYQSLHTTISYQNIYIEIQIRTKEMDYQANYGIASHWKYKESKNSSEEKYFFHQLIDDVIHNKNTINNEEQLSKIFSNKVYDVLILNDNKWTITNESNTILDLAFKHNKNDFLTLSSVNVNNERVTFNYKPKPGDIIRFNYSTIIKAQKLWVKLVTFSEAKEMIEKYFEDTKIENEKSIKEYIEKIAKSLDKKYVGDEEFKARIIKKLNINTLFEFFEKAKEFNICEEDIKTIASKNYFSNDVYTKILEIFDDQKTKKINYFKGLENVNYKTIVYPKCCSKVPYKECVAIFEDRKKIAVHSINCKETINERKKILITWDKEKLKNFPRKFICNISFECLGTFLSQIFVYLGTSKLNIESIETKLLNNNNRKINVRLSVLDMKEAFSIIGSLEKNFSLWNMEVI